MAKRRSPRRKSNPEEDLRRLDPRPWPELDDNQQFHSTEENRVAQERCRQLINGGWGAVDW